MSRHPMPITPVVIAFMSTLLVGFSVPSHAVQNTTTQYMQYDANGNPIRIASPLDTASNPVKTDLRYDSLGRLYKIFQPIPATGSARPDIFIDRDGQDRPTLVNDPRGLVTGSAFDGLGNQIALASPDSGATDATYDAVGNLMTRTDARGKLTTYSYDLLNRLTAIDYATGTDTAFTYDGGPANTVAANIGKLTRISDESGTTGYGYNAIGQLVSKTQNLAETPPLAQSAWTKTVVYAYGTTGTARGNVSSLTYPSGNRINYTYDAAGRISGIKLNPTNANGIGPDTTVITPLLTGIEYTPTGQFRSGTWSNSTDAAPNTLDHVDDLDGRVWQYNLGNLSAGLGGLARTLMFDPASRVKTMTHTGTGGGAFAPANFDQTFTYDNLGRLKSYTSATGSQSYGYDASGNRILAGTFSHNVDLNSNRLLSTTGPAPAKSNGYDEAGNLNSDGTITYAYSDRGRLQSVQLGATVTRYAYNGLGQRVKKVGAADNTVTQYVYDEQGHLLGEYDFYGRPLQETVYLGDMPIAVLTQTVTATAAGSVTADNTDAGNAIVGSWPASNAIAGFQGANYQTHAASAATDSFTWKLALPAAGKYFFQAIWTADATRAIDATYSVAAADGVSSRALNQRLSNNTWINLGLKAVTAANLNATVKLAASGLGTVSADAVRALPAVVGTRVNYIFTDHLDTPRVITRATDNKMVWRWDQADPFGVSQPNENPNGLGVFKYNPRFPGQVYDAETGLHYNYRRHYEPDTGTYTQPDPIGLAGGINTYAYVGGNPVNAIDPDGRNPLIYGGLRLLAALMPMIDLQMMAVDDVPGGGGACGVAKKASLNVDTVIAETLAGKGKITSSVKVSADELLQAGEQFLGNGYREIGKSGSGVFRSADDLRQFRIDDNSLLGNHSPTIPHGHLETYAPGAAKPTTNNHIPFFD